MQNDVSTVAIHKPLLFDSGFFIPNKPVSITSYKDLITHISYRSGHDIHYAIDATNIQTELGWTPKESFESGLRKTVLWYLNELTRT
ncbi:hypothetical protein C5F62_01195 [Photobacterium damselae subsp. damselae]|nr:hypothetical protein C5F62_01195 [Photobacterium damselae subsp. damselae]